MRTTAAAPMSSSSSSSSSAAPPPLVAALPPDVLVRIGVLVADLPSFEALLATCRALHGEALHAALALEQWGAAFWRRALTRPTHRRFRGMREELRTIHRFERALRALGQPPWTAAEYEAFWRC